MEWKTRVNGEVLSASDVNAIQTGKADIRKLTAAGRVALGGLSTGEFGFETDTKDVYIGASGGDQLVSDASAWAHLTGQDQAVKTTASPTFVTGTIIAGFPIVAKALDNFWFGASGVALTTGVENVGFGKDCLAAITSGTYNTAFGFRALAAQTTQTYATAFGHEALLCSNAMDSCAFGARALRSLTTGGSNHAFGTVALTLLTTGEQNCAFGAWTLHDSVDGYRNCAFGHYALTKMLGGTDNVGVGFYAAPALTTGLYNVAVGASSLFKATISSQNVAVGRYSLYNNLDGSGNTAIGYGTLFTSTGGIYCVAIGNKAGWYETGNYKLFIDVFTRASEADGRIKALIYGIFDTVSANQRLRINGRLGVTHLPNYANNTAAVAGGLVSGELYTVTGTDPLQVAAVI